MLAVWVLLSAQEPAADLPSRHVRVIRPRLDASCVRCHNPQKKKGGVDLASAKLDDRRLWRRAVEQLASGAMPPEDEPKLADADRAALLAGLREAAEFIAPRAPQDPGPPVLRRLNRTEYANTLRDLLGLNTGAADKAGLPEESRGTGYDTAGAILGLTPSLMEAYVAAADHALDALYANAGAKKKILEGSPREAIERFARRACRRPAAASDVDPLLSLFAAARARGLDVEASLRYPLKAALCSPSFLLRVEEDRPAAPGRLGAPVSAPELATRLAYFLWSRPPDDALLSLSDPDAVLARAPSMLADGRARALVDRFFAQWLRLEDLDRARPSTEFFPAFTRRLRGAMRDEVLTFVDRLRVENRSVFELLRADYAWVNEDLAKHYGLSGVKGEAFTRVALPPDSPRGGLLGMGAILAMTSHTHRTSPTLRGKWILDVLLGTPPPPPPPDAGTIKEDRKGKDPRSFRELLAQHAGAPVCASCHRRIDPLGFGLEGFNA